MGKIEANKNASFYINTFKLVITRVIILAGTALALQSCGNPMVFIEGVEKIGYIIANEPPINCYFKNGNREQIVCPQQYKPPNDRWPSNNDMENWDGNNNNW